MEWISLHFCFLPIEIPPIQEHRITRDTFRIRLVRGWRNLERNSYGSRPWVGGQSIRVRIPRRKAQTRTRWSHPNWRQFPKPKMYNSNFLGGDQVLRTSTSMEATVPRTKRSSRRPSWRIRRVSTNHQSKKSLHNKSFKRSVRSSPKLLRKFWETCHELLQQADLRRPLQVKSCYNGSWFLNEFFLKLALFNIHDTFKALNWSSSVSLKLVYLTNHEVFNCVKRQMAEKHGGGTCGGGRRGLFYPVTLWSQHARRGDLCSSGIAEEQLLTNSANQAMST